ncbi:MAG: NAD-dependent DNA ligase LigA [Eubacterium sp.]|nr:NAD-dependent DNA ligase LigA [Eubacterium sp.]
MRENQYQELIKKINYHMDLYYNQDQPQISDYEYDMLMQELKKAEKEHPEWVTKDSPSQKIGGVAKREAGVKVTHDVPMLSIEDVFDEEDLLAWVDKVQAMHPQAIFSVETKIDGLSATLRYSQREDGKLHLDLCETRGDGMVGENVTANALVIPDVKQVLDLPYPSLQVRGEVYMDHQAFEQFNEAQEAQGKKTAANPRNLAAGTLRQLDPSITRERGLRIFIFNVQQGPEELMVSHQKSMEVIEKSGLPVAFHRSCKNGQEVIDCIHQIAQMRSELDYDIDGAVVKIDQISYREDFPGSSKYTPGHIAYKYPPEERVVVMDQIQVDVGRTGKLTFTGIVSDRETGKPARLCGTNVSRVTLHNQDYIRQMKIGIGGSYKLFKSGEIIPKLNGCVEEPAEIFTAPDKCPVCGAPLVWEEDTADIKCISSTCPAQCARTIAYFASLNCMNIVGLGQTLVDSLIKEGYLHSYADIYGLKNHRQELIEKGIIGKEKNTDKILAAIEESKKNSPDKLLAGLGIRNVGVRTAKDIMKHFSGIQELMGAKEETLQGISDIGQVTARCIIEFFQEEENQKIMGELEAYGLNMQVEEEEVNSQVFLGKTLVVTGTLSQMSRKEAVELIEKNGGKASSSVSKKTSMVLAGEAAGSKLDKAIQLNVPVISEEEFLEMIR